MDIDQSPIKQDLSIAQKTFGGLLIAGGSMLAVHSLIKYFGEIDQPAVNSVFGILGIAIACFGISKVFRKFPTGARNLAIMIVVLFLISIGRYLFAV